MAHLGAGDHASVYVVRDCGGAPVWRDHASVVIKLYKPEAGLSEEMVTAQFASLARLHTAVDGLRVDGWAISSPQPLHICTSPLALVMTEIPGKIDLRSGTGHDPDLTPERLDELGRVLACAMLDNWAQRKLHGDLGLQNMLYDLKGRRLSLVDPGTRECCVVCNEPSHRWSPAILELGHILRDLGTDVRNLTGNPLARLRRELFIKSALRTYIATIDTPAERHQVLQEIRACALHHLAKVLAPAFTLRGLLRTPLTRFVERRTDQILAELEADLVDTAAPPRGMSPPLAPSTRATASAPTAGALEFTAR